MHGGVATLSNLTVRFSRQTWQNVEIQTFSGILEKNASIIFLQHLTDTRRTAHHTWQTDAVNFQNHQENED